MSLGASLAKIQLYNLTACSEGITLPVTMKVFVREVPVGVFELGLQNVPVAPVLILDGVLLALVSDFSEDKYSTKDEFRLEPDRVHQIKTLVLLKN